MNLRTLLTVTAANRDALAVMEAIEAIAEDTRPVPLTGQVHVQLPALRERLDELRAAVAHAA